MNNIVPNCSNYYGDENDWGFYVDVENIRPSVECNFEKMTQLYGHEDYSTNNTQLERMNYSQMEGIPDTFINVCSSTFVTATISFIVLFFML